MSKKVSFGLLKNSNKVKRMRFTKHRSEVQETIIFYRHVRNTSVTSFSVTRQLCQYCKFL